MRGKCWSTSSTHWRWSSPDARACGTDTAGGASMWAGTPRLPTADIRCLPQSDADDAGQKPGHCASSLIGPVSALATGNGEPGWRDHPDVKRSLRIAGAWCLPSRTYCEEGKVSGPTALIALREAGCLDLLAVIINHHDLCSDL